MHACIIISVASGALALISALNGECLATSLRFSHSLHAMQPMFDVVASKSEYLRNRTFTESEANQWIHYLNKKWQRLGFGFDGQSRASLTSRQNASPIGQTNGPSNSATPQTARVSSSLTSAQQWPANLHSRGHVISRLRLTKHETIHLRLLLLYNLLESEKGAASSHLWPLSLSVETQTPIC